MKKMFLILGLLLLALPMVLAEMPEEAGLQEEAEVSDEAEMPEAAEDGLEEAENVTPEDVEQAAAMDTPTGAEIRLMQLERSINRNVETGRIALDRIAEEYSEEELSGLEELLEELESLSEEVSTMSTEGESSEIAKEFVAIKAEARELTKQFREASRELVTEQAREEIRDRAREVSESEEAQQLQQQIRERINEHNSERVREITERMGVNGTGLAEAVRNGEISVGEAVSEVARGFSGLGEEQRNESMARANEIRAQREVHKNEIAQQAIERANERVAEAKERASAARERIQSVVDEARSRADRVDRDAGDEEEALAEESVNETLADDATGEPRGGVSE